ncbi:hypothetical protein FQN50_009181 [Emmonsiellopsis sp. PD_5]|nr:hypothetical protein FQN50_009181 [Emmonsiellopsis sp. PD_5]
MATKETTTAVLVAVAAANKLPEAYLRKTSEAQQVAETALRIEERTARALDAIAAVLVKAPREEEISVGLQVDYGSPGSVTITVAANKNVPEAAVQHLTEIWTALCKLRSKYRAEQRNEKLKKQTYADETPPKPREAPLPAEYCELVKLVYGYSFAKFSRRLEKRHDKMMSAFNTLKNRLKSGELDDDDDTVLNLCFVLRNLRLFHNYGLSKIQEDQFVKDMTLAFFAFRRLQSEEEKSRTRAMLGASFEDIWRHMEKGLSFQTAIMDLDRFSSSRRMSTILAKSLIVNRLPAAVSAELPSQISDWQIAAQDATKGLEPTDKLDTALHKAHTVHRGKRGVVHSELKLLEHFVTRPADSIPPLSYIGVSKLSCLGCWTAINAWNKTRDAPRYAVRGTHGKWYFPWAVPTGIAKDEQAGSRIYSDLQEEVVKCLRQHGLCHLRSDSSAGPANTQWISLNDERLTTEYRKKLLREELEAGP